MALKIVVYYNETELTFAVTKQEDDVYYLRTNAAEENNGAAYIPQKIIIRRKGKIWVSDVEDHPDLIAQLTAEVKQLSVTNEITTHE